MCNGKHAPAGLPWWWSQPGLLLREKAAPGLGKTTSPIAQRFAQEADIAAGVAILFLVRAVSVGQPGDLRFARRTYALLPPDTRKFIPLPDITPRIAVMGVVGRHANRTTYTPLQA